MKYIIQKIETLEEIMKFYPILQQLFDYISKDSVTDVFPDLVSSGAVFVGLYVESKPVGFMQYHVANSLENFKYIVLDELVVDQKHRSLGYGSKILEYVQDQAKESNINAIGLLSGVKREKAHKFYIQNGFEFRSKWFAKWLSK